MAPDVGWEMMSSILNYPELKYADVEQQLLESPFAWTQSPGDGHPSKEAFGVMNVRMELPTYEAPSASWEFSEV